ncbi:hypothetical protein MA6G0212_3617 [Mycobacteroides abscessus 6G-0212]|nr:hypothetical protein MA6G0125S_3631 [Mycobacteroides abscessus 6G-0125-S]EIU55217.1 hypothetical protein MA6G1108_3556 [Mycobacteroides abscessus 6G-1108]EIU88660.1 hypothetical protein MA6G0212_3617 [Mycobacteroides abscessus 6G-0212]
MRAQPRPHAMALLDYWPDDLPWCEIRYHVWQEPLLKQQACLSEQ